MENMVACKPPETFGDMILTIESQQDRILALLLEIHSKFFNSPAYQVEPANCLGYEDKLAGIMGTNIRILDILIETVNRV